MITHGGDGNDTLVGPVHSDARELRRPRPGRSTPQLLGDSGDDTLTATGGQQDLLDGGGGTDTLKGADREDGLHGAAAPTRSPLGASGDETIDPGAGDDTITLAGTGHNTVLGGGVASVVTIHSSLHDESADARHERQERGLRINLKDGKILVGWGSRTPPPPTSPASRASSRSTTRWSSTTSTPSGPSSAARAATSSPSSRPTHRPHPMTINGRGGNDTYDFINFGSGALKFNAIVNDTGNPWDSGDQIVVNGNSGTDSVTLTGNDSGGDITGASNQLIHYNAPAANANVLSVVLNGNDGADTLNVVSTSTTVPVKVDGGLGNDIITVGDPAAGLAGIKGLTRPGLQTPYGVGPVVIVGGGGIDTLVVTDHADTHDQLGSLESVGRGAADGAGRHRGRRGRRPRDDAVRGLRRDDVRPEPGRRGPDRVRGRRGAHRRPGLGHRPVHGRRRLAAPRAAAGTPAEGVLLRPDAGRADDDPRQRRGRRLPGRLDDRARPRRLRRGRRPHHSLDVHDGVTGSVSEVQHIDLRDGKVDNENSFKLRLGNGTFTAAMLFTVDATTLESNLRTATGISGLTVTGGSGVFLVTFPNAQGNVDLLTATHVNKLVSGSTTQNGCDGLTGCGPVQDEIQHLHIDSTTTGGNGYFTVHLGFQETKALQLNVCATGAGCLDEAIKTAFTDIDALHSLLSVTATAGGFDVEFKSLAGNVGDLVPELMPLYIDGGAGGDQLNVQSVYEDMYFNGNAGSDSSNVNINATTLAAFHPGDVVGHLNIRDTTPGVLSSQIVSFADVTGGTFELGIGGNWTIPIAWDAPATGACIKTADQVNHCSVQAALELLFPGHTKPFGVVSNNDGSYTITFIGDVAPAQLQSNLAVTNNAPGVGNPNDTQQIDISKHNGQDTSFSTFSLDYTYPLVPLGLALDPNAVGALVAGTYSYVVTAVTPQGQSLPTPVQTTQIGPGGAITLTWGDVPNVTNYRVYRVAAPVGITLGYFETPTATFFDNTNGVPITGTLPPSSSTATGTQTTIPIAIDASAAVVEAALAALPSIGKDSNGNNNVHVTSTGAGHYLVEFVHDLAGKTILTLVGNVSSLRSNGLHAIATIDGGLDPDQYEINTVGGITNSLVNIFDSGAGPGDSLTVLGTDFADVFLLRAATSDNGLAFIALINGADAAHAQLGPTRSSASTTTARSRRSSSTARGRRPVLHRRHARLDHDQRRRGQRLLPGRPAVQVAPHACSSRASRPRTSSRRSRRRRAG